MHCLCIIKLLNLLVMLYRTFFVCVCGVEVNLVKDALFVLEFKIIKLLNAFGYAL